MQAWDSFPLSFIIRHLTGALRRGYPGSILQRCRGQQAGLRILHQDSGSYKPSAWGRSSDTQGQAVQSCPPSSLVSGWQLLCPSPLAADHGGVPCSCSSSHSLSSDSIAPPLIHASAHSLPGCWQAAAAGRRRHSHARTLAGCACVWGRGNREEPSFWRGRLSF